MEVGSVCNGARDNGHDPPRTGLNFMPKECTICSKSYTEALLLPCMHSFCRVCVESKAKGGTFHCPVCVGSKAVSMDAMPLNCFLMRRQAGDAYPVGPCTQHPSIPYADALYCDTCKIIVCPMFKCLNAAHGTHEVTQLQEMAQTIQSQRDDLHAGVGQVSATLATTVEITTDAIHSRLDAMVKHLNSVRSTMRLLAEQHIAKVRSVLECELQRLDEHEVTCRSSCQKRLRELSCDGDLSEKTTALATLLADSGTEKDILLLSKTVAERLEVLTRWPVNNRPPPLGHVVHNGSAVCEDQVILNLLGGLSIIHVDNQKTSSDVVREKDGRVNAMKLSTTTMTVTVRASDDSAFTSQDNALTTHWEKIPDSVIDPPDISIEVKDDGTFFLSFVLPEEGTYKLHVNINGDEISDSPYEFMCNSDNWTMDPEFCTKGVTIQDSGLTLFKHELGHSSMLGRLGWEKGVHTWRITVSDKQNCYAGIALRVPEALSWKGSKSPAVVWCFSTNGYRYSDHGVESIRLGEGGSMVDFTLDCDNHSFKMKNVDSGAEDEITDLPPDVCFYPWFHLYYLKTKFSVILQEGKSAKREQEEQQPGTDN